MSPPIARADPITDGAELLLECWDGFSLASWVRTCSLLENLLFLSLLDDRARSGRNVDQAASGVDDVAAIAERSDRIGSESPGIDDVADRAHRVRPDRVGDPVAAQPLGGAVVVFGHHRVGVSAVQECTGAAGGEALLPRRREIAADQQPKT